MTKIVLDYCAYTSSDEEFDFEAIEATERELLQGDKREKWNDSRDHDWSTQCTGNDYFEITSSDSDDDSKFNPHREYPSDSDADDVIRVSQYEQEVADFAILDPFCVQRPKSLLMEQQNAQEWSDLRISVPTQTLNSQKDPTVFYRMPVGYGFWDAAHALSAHLADSQGDLNHFLRLDARIGTCRLPSTLNGLRVIELGSGIAPLPALTAAALGAKYSLATDYLPDIVDWAQANLNRNRHCLLPGTEMASEYLKWGEPMVSEEDSENKFDVLLGADVMYAHLDVLEDLAISVTNHLSKTGTLLVLTRTERMGERESWWVNEVLIRKYGWTLVSKFNDDRAARWIKYGRMGHNARPGAQDRLEVLTLVRNF